MALETGLALYETRENDGPLGGDVVLEICDGTEARIFKAHVLILSLRSPVWAAEFREGAFKEGRERRVQIQQVKPCHFQVFLQLLYTTKLDDPSMLLEFTAQDMMEVVVLADRYGVTGLATEVSNGVSRRLTWGTNVASVFSLLKQLPQESEYRVGLIGAISKKIHVSSIHFEREFQKECTVLGDDVEVGALQSKMLFVQTVKAKLMQSWEPSLNSKVQKNAMEVLDAYVWRTLTVHGLTSDEPALKRQRTESA